MDPTALLERIRSLVEDVLAQEHKYPDEEDLLLAEAINDLDEWLTKGGFLPHDWLEPVKAYYLGDEA